MMQLKPEIQDYIKELALVTVIVGFFAVIITCIIKFDSSSLLTLMGSNFAKGGYSGFGLGAAFIMGIKRIIRWIEENL